MILRRVVVLSKDIDIQQLARQVGREIFVADDIPEAIDIIETVGPEMVLFGLEGDAEELGDFIDSSNSRSLSLPVIAVGNCNISQAAVTEFIRMGAYDYISSKDSIDHIKKIAQGIKNSSLSVETPQDNEKFFAKDYAASIEMVGSSRATRNTLRMLEMVAASQCNPVLVVGDTGTGKELAAKAIHELRHPKEPFVAVNCAALTANLLESELFGHVKGSFTSADRDKPGLLELAGKGTIFLDEISEMPLDLQAKLLRVLQEKTFRKVGGVKLHKCNATIVASSNRKLMIEVQENRFRRDLYYRLSTCPITIAPLKSPDRKQDIRLLAEYFLTTSSICPDKSNKINSLTKMAIEALEKHDWPGNVRELKNVIERAIILESTDKIGLSSIVIDPDHCGEVPTGMVADHITDFSLAKAERELIARALQETGWQKTRAATLLGITRATLYAKVKQYNIEKGLYIPKEVDSEEFVPSVA